MCHLLAIVTVLAMSSSAVAETAAEKAKSDCAVKAYAEYKAASLALYQREGAPLSVAGVIARRRLVEGYCVQFVRCLNVAETAMGAMFSKCLDDEDEERLNE